MDLHRHPLRLGGPCGQAPEFATPGINQRSVARTAQEPHRVVLVEGELLRRAARQRLAPDVEAAAALTQPQERIARGRPDRAAVLAPEVGQPAVAARALVEQPDVARRIRDMVLAPLVLGRWAVFVEHPLAIRGLPHGFRRNRQHHARTAARGGHGVHLPRPAPGLRSIQRIGCRGTQPVGREQHLLAIGTERLRHIGARVVGQAGHGTALRGHDEHVVVAVALRRKHQAAPVGRPDRVVAVELVGGHRSRFTAGRRDHPDLPAVAEGDAAAVGGHRGGSQPQGPFGIGGWQRGCGR